MTLTPPKHGDIRVCYVPLLLEDHAVSQSVIDIATAKAVHDAIIAVHLMQLDHGVHNQRADVAVQVFDEDRGWIEVFDLTKEIN